MKSRRCWGGTTGFSAVVVVVVWLAFISQQCEGTAKKTGGRLAGRRRSGSRSSSKSKFLAGSSNGDSSYFVDGGPAEYDAKPEESQTNAEGELLTKLLGQKQGPEKSYNPKARPVLDYDTPITVNFSVTLNQILGMNIKEQQLKTNLWYNFIWYDEFLKWDPKEYGGVDVLRVPIEEIWKPDVLLYNSISESFDTAYKSNAVISSTGLVNWVPPAIVESSCRVNVRYYPFDEQKCPFKFGPWTHDITKLDLKLTSAEADLSTLTESAEWKVMDMPAVREEVLFECCKDMPPYVFVTFTLHLVRYHKDGNMNVILPCLTVCVLSVLVFLLPPDAGEKIGLGITILLTLVVFLQILGDKTPPTSDEDPSPVIATFFAFTMFMVMLSIVATVMTLFMHHRHVVLQDAMPPWIRSLFLFWLPVVVRLTPPGDEHPPRWAEIKQRFSNIFAEKGDSSYGSQDANKTEKNQLIVVSAQDIVSEGSGGTVESVDDLAEARSLAEVHRKELSKIHYEVKRIADYIYEKEEEHEQEDEWKFAAMVLDRLCLYVFTVALIMGMFLTLGTAPGFIKV